MEEREKKEEQNKRIGWLTSVGVQLVLLILFYFIIAWREPFPPIPEYGIELGFTTSAGAPTSSPAPVSEAEEVIEESQEDEITEDVTETEQGSSESEAQEQNDDVVEDSTPTEEVIENTQDTAVPEVEENDVTEESQESEPEVETPKVDSRALMQSSETESEEEGESESEGEEEQEVDQRAIYGSQGTNSSNAEGASLEMAGWIWDKEPEPDDQSNAAGKIVFKITVDDNGELRGITTELSTVSQSVERKYREAVEKLSFLKTSDYKSAQLSTGTITFIIKSK